MTHRELVKRGVSWLANRKNCRVVLAEQPTGLGEIPDAIGWKYGDQSWLIEVKVSRADFFADRCKAFRSNPESGMGLYRYFMVPAGMLTVADVEGSCRGWGLLEVRGRIIRELRKADAQDKRNLRGEMALMVTALSQAQMRVTEPLHEWLTGPGSPVAELREHRRRIAKEERKYDLTRTCDHYDVTVQPFVRCGVLVASGQHWCSEHGGRTRGERRKQKVVREAYGARTL